MRPEQVIDCQSDLVARMREPEFRAFVRRVMEPGELTQPELRAHRMKMAPILTEHLSRDARLAYAYRVTADMTALVQHAALTLDDTDLFSPDLAPAENGIVFFERPLAIYDARGATMLAQWLVWGRTVLDGVRPGTESYWFNDHLLNPDQFAVTAIGPVIGRWGFIGCTVTVGGDAVGPPAVDVDYRAAAEITLQGGQPTAFTNTVRYLHALWMLLGQSVTVVTEEHVRKTAWKRARGLGIPGRVSVIALRSRAAARREGESLIDWSHRWLVRGHPRWQPYGPLGAQKIHVEAGHALGPTVVENGHSARYCQHAGCDYRVERLWIEGFVKGPEDKPLIVREHVYDLRR